MKMNLAMVEIKISMNELKRQEIKPGLLFDTLLNDKARRIMECGSVLICIVLGDHTIQF